MKRTKMEYLMWRFQLFWDKVDIDTTPNGCYTWTASVNNCGYGLTKLKGRSITAHRFAFIFYHGYMPPENLEINHTCHNRRCVRKEHLFLASHTTNMTTASNTGRMNRNSKQCRKYDFKTILEIKRRADAGERITDISREMNLPRSSVHHIARRKYWKHVE